jgi:hypothetical protein
MDRVTCGLQVERAQERTLDIQHCDSAKGVVEDQKRIRTGENECGNRPILSRTFALPSDRSQMLATRIEEANLIAASVEHGDSAVRQPQHISYPKKLMRFIGLICANVSHRLQRYFPSEWRGSWSSAVQEDLNARTVARTEISLSRSTF